MARGDVRIPDQLGDGHVRLRPLRKDDIPAWVGAFAADPQLGVMLGASGWPARRAGAASPATRSR